MAIDLIVRRVEQRLFLIGRRGGDFAGRNHPDAHPFIATGVQLTGVFDCHAAVGCMHTADVLVVKTVLAAYKNFKEGPVSHEKSLSGQRSLVSQDSMLF